MNFLKEIAASNLDTEDKAKWMQLQDYINCEDSFLQFVKSAWGIVEPGRPFISNWHIEAICEHLEAVTFGEIKNLLINVPPGTCKSMLVSTMWPVWLWIVDPIKRIISISHNDSLPIRDARKARKIIESKWFSARWGNKTTFTHDQNQKKKYENTQGGYRQSFGITAGITGEKADVIIIDDPHDAKTAMFSEVERKSTLNAFDMAISTRGIDSDSAMVIIMQRLHEEDLSGHVLEEGDWEHLMFPMEYESDRQCATCFGVQDPRKEEGELLWPEYHDKERVEKQKKRLRAIGIAGQLQQRPSSPEGNIINVDKIQRYKVLPNKDLWLKIIVSADTAQKENELTNDPSVFGVWVQTQNSYYLIDFYRDWLSQPKLERLMVDINNKHHPHVFVIEDKSSGQGLIQYAKEETTIPVYPMQPDNNKVIRMSNESGAVEAGKVFIPDDAPWVVDLIGRWKNFPNGKYKDDADMLSQTLRYFRENKSNDVTGVELISMESTNIWQ